MNDLFPQRTWRLVLIGLFCVVALWLAGRAAAATPDHQAVPPKVTPPAAKVATLATNAPTTKPELALKAKAVDPAAAAAVEQPATEGPITEPIPALAGTNQPTPEIPKDVQPQVVDELKRQLEVARALRASRKAAEAQPRLVELLGEKSPDFIKKAALLELAAAAQDGNDLPRAQQIYGQYMQRWMDDQYVPEILLRQGHLFRRMGLNNLALAKFYAVMTSALVLRHDQFDYYSRLVIQAQTEIAETHYLLEKYPEAAEYLTRLLKQESPLINRLDAQFKLVRCLANTGKHDEAIGQAQDFLARYPQAKEQPEVRFHLALSLKQVGRNNEALTQVLALLREQSSKAKAQPEVWAYWQQRTGNLIANQLYREGDYTRALDIYLSLVQLDRSPGWQLPVWYQVGMTYEKLWQPQKAVETYNQIVARESVVPATAAPGLRAVVDMARWRAGFVRWQNKAEGFNQSFHGTNSPPLAGLPATTANNP